MATSADKFCTICDPSPVKASEWCSECDDFLCTECVRHHNASKLSKCHSAISIDDYNQLPTFVQNLKFHCEEHEERLDSFCPSHNSSCCTRCLLTSHKTCEGVALLKDIISNAKESPSILEIDQILTELGSFIEKAIVEKERNKQEIYDQKGKIQDEINLVRKTLNDHLDVLEEQLIENLNSKIAKLSSEMDNHILEFKEVQQKIKQIASDHVKIKDHASNLQTFLSLPHVIASVDVEENHITKWERSDKLKYKRLNFEKDTESLLKIQSFGLLHIFDDMPGISYLKHKEKQAQFLGPVTKSYLGSITLSKINTFSINKQPNSGNEITGCDILKNDKLLISVYNEFIHKDHVAVYSIGNNFEIKLRTSVFDVTSIDESKFVTSVNQNDVITRAISTSVTYDACCYGIAHAGDCLFICVEGTGIQMYNMISGAKKLLVKTSIDRFSYVTFFNDKLFYSCGTGHNTVSCCDTTGKSVWNFKDICILSEPRGVAVDKHGYVFVAGEGSNNIIMISPDGKHTREIEKVTKPRALCYDTTKHQIIVCNDSAVYVFQISDNWTFSSTSIDQIKC